MLGELRPGQYGTTAGLWHLNGNSTDSSGNGNNGTDTNITYSQANGKFGQGALFTRTSSSKIAVGAGASLQFNKPLSLVCWVKTTYKAITQTIYNNGNHWSALITTNGYPGLYTTGLSVFSAPLDITSLGWVHLAFVDESNTSHKIYINGNLHTTSTTNDTTNFTSSATKYLGSTPVPNEFFDGSLEEVYLTPTALTANQIRQIYALGVGKYF